MTCPKLGPWLGDEGPVRRPCRRCGGPSRPQRRRLPEHRLQGARGGEAARHVRPRRSMERGRPHRRAPLHHRGVGRPDGAVCDPASESECHREDTCGRWADVQAVLRVPVDAHRHGRPHRPAELHPHASKVLREAARRTLADPENVTPSSQAARLNRASPHHLTAGPPAEAVGPRRRVRSPSMDRKRKPDGAISLRRPPAAGTRIWAWSSAWRAGAVSPSPPRRRRNVLRGRACHMAGSRVRVK